MNTYNKTSSKERFFVVSGWYQCIVENMYGTAKSRVAEVTRAVLEFDADTEVDEKTANVGEALTVR